MFPRWDVSAGRRKTKSRLSNMNLVRVINIIMAASIYLSHLNEIDGYGKCSMISVLHLNATVKYNYPRTQKGKYKNMFYQVCILYQHERNSSAMTLKVFSVFSYSFVNGYIHTALRATNTNVSIIHSKWPLGTGMPMNEDNIFILWDITR